MPPPTTLTPFSRRLDAPWRAEKAFKLALEKLKIDNEPAKQAPLPPSHTPSRSPKPCKQAIEASLAVPTSFPLFAMLPTEIRLRIWHFARPEPQLIQLKVKKNDENALYSASPPPPIVHACYESREYALHHWYTDYPIDFHYLLVPYFFNPKIDVLYLGCYECTSSLYRRCEQCRRVSMILADRDQSPTKCERVLMHFTGGINPWAVIADRYIATTELFLLSQRTGPLRKGTVLSDLVESKVPFPGQGGLSFHEWYLRSQRASQHVTRKVGRERAFAFGLEYMTGVEPKYRPWDLKRKRHAQDVGRLPGVFPVKRPRLLRTIEDVKFVGEGYRVPTWSSGLCTHIANSE